MSWRATSSPPCSDARGNPPAPSPAAASTPAPPAPPPATAPSGPGSAPAFFLEPLPHHRHEQVRQPHQRHVGVPTDPRPRLVLRHPEVTLAVLKELLDPAASAGHQRQRRQRVGVSIVGGKCRTTKPSDG